MWGFFTFQCFVFFLIFAFSCLSFSSFPLLLDFLKPKSGPSNEVIGYMAITSISGPKKRSKFQFFPSFIAKKWPRKKPTLGVGVFHVSMFCHLSHLCLFCLSFSSFPLLLDFLKPKSGPSNEVIGYMAITSISGPKKVKIFVFSPVLKQKNGLKNPRTKCGGFLVRVQERLFPQFYRKMAAHRFSHGGPFFRLIVADAQNKKRHV